MKYLLQVLLLGILTGCAPRIATSTATAIEQAALLLEQEEYTVLQHQFPALQITERTLIKEKEAHTKRDKAALRLQENQLTPIIFNNDKSCGLIKVLTIQSNARMRVRYIYLADSTKEGERLANVILEAHENGEDFAELAKQYAQDGNSKRGGDLNWFDETAMIKDFTGAIRQHKKGDVFKVNTREYGWYVISYTHDFRERTEYKIVEIKQEACGS